MARGEGVLIGREAVDCARIAHMAETEIRMGNNKGSQVHYNNYDFRSRLRNYEFK